MAIRMHIDKYLSFIKVDKNNTMLLCFASTFLPRLENDLFGPKGFISVLSSETLTWHIEIILNPAPAPWWSPFTGYRRFHVKHLIFEEFIVWKNNTLSTKCPLVQ